MRGLQYTLPTASKPVEYRALRFTTSTPGMRARSRGSKKFLIGSRLSTMASSCALKAAGVLGGAIADLRDAESVLELGRRG